MPPHLRDPSQRISSVRHVKKRSNHVHLPDSQPSPTTELQLKITYIYRTSTAESRTFTGHGNTYLPDSVMFIHS